MRSKGGPPLPPSLAFYIYHPPSGIKIAYDLGLRKGVEIYPPMLAKRLSDGTRIVEVPSDVGESLQKGGVKPSDINLVILGHVNYDHTGNAEQLSKSRFLVGPGTMNLIQPKVEVDTGETWFLSSQLPSDLGRVIELPDPEAFPEGMAIWEAF